MKPIKNRIEEIKANGYQLDFAKVFNHAFENYKKIALYAGLVLFLFFVLFIVLVAVMTASFFDIDSLTEKLNPENFKIENSTLEFMAIYIFSLILFSCLLAPFTAGFLKMADCAEKDKEFNVSTIFEYYKSPYFIRIFSATLFITLFGTGFSTVLDFYQISFMGSFISIVVSFLTVLTIPLIVFGNLKTLDALKSSVIIVMKQPLILLGLLAVAGIASFVGLIGFCIGIFFTIPFLYSMYYAIYNEIVGIDSESELEEIGIE